MVTVFLSLSTTTPGVPAFFSCEVSCELRMMQTPITSSTRHVFMRYSLKTVMLFAPLRLCVSLFLAYTHNHRRLACVRPLQVASSHVKPTALHDGPAVDHAGRLRFLCGAEIELPRS